MRDHDDDPAPRPETDDVWRGAVSVDGHTSVWPTGWVVGGPPGAWTWGATELADDASPVALTATADLSFPSALAPLSVRITALIDPVDGLFSVKLAPAGAPFAPNWAALVQAALALGEPVHDDIGLMALDLGAIAVYIDRLDHHVEIRPRHA